MYLFRLSTEGGIRVMKTFALRTVNHVLVGTVAFAFSTGVHDAFNSTVNHRCSFFGRSSGPTTGGGLEATVDCSEVQECLRQYQQGCDFEYRSRHPLFAKAV